MCCALKYQTSLQEWSFFCITQVEMETKEGKDRPRPRGSQRSTPTSKPVSGCSSPGWLGGVGRGVGKEQEALVHVPLGLFPLPIFLRKLPPAACANPSTDPSVLGLKGSQLGFPLPFLAFGFLPYQSGETKGQITGCRHKGNSSQSRLGCL